MFPRVPPFRSFDVEMTVSMAFFQRVRCSTLIAARGANIAATSTWSGHSSKFGYRSSIAQFILADEDFHTRIVSRTEDRNLDAGITLIVAPANRELRYLAVVQVRDARERVQTELVELSRSARRLVPK